MQEQVPVPTIGRIVYLYDQVSSQPFAGIVADVVGVHTINVCAIAHSGDLVLGGMQNVPHVADKAPTSNVWWDWMPFQKGQAGKTEELQRQLDLKAANSQHKVSSPSVHGQGSSGVAVDSEMGKLQAGAPSPVDGKR